MAKRLRPQRGATAVEFSVVLLPFLLLIFGIIEGGWLFHDYAELKNGVAEGARRASVAGNSPDADYQILQQLGEHATLDPSSITKIIVFHASETVSQPSPGCRAGTPSTVAGAECNVYSGSDLTRAATDFGCVSALDNAWCPTKRVSTPGAGDFVGVYVEMEHDFVVSIFGSAMSIDRSQVQRLERKVGP